MEEWKGAHTWFCLMTTFERILRDEVTIAAQVSSAEDSRARTVKCRSAAVRRREGDRRGRLIKVGGVAMPVAPHLRRWTLQYILG